MSIAISEREEPSEIPLAKLAIQTRKLRKVYGLSLIHI
jgi:hypothetical protein